MIREASFLIWVLLPNHKRLNNYISGMIKITKDIESNEITSCVFSKSMAKDMKSIEVAHADLKVHLKQNNEGAGELSCIISYIEDTKAECQVLQRDVYAIKDTDRLIRQYLRYQGRISKGKSSVNPQILDIGSGIDMNESGNSKTLMLEYSMVSIQTIAMMFAIDVVVKNKYHAMLNYYRG